MGNRYLEYCTGVCQCIVSENWQLYKIIGVGGIGSGSLYWLSKLSQRFPKTGGLGILGIEQFRLGHDNGSSQDISRTIRYMYHDASYIKLAPGSYETWEAIESESGIKLVTKTGGLFFTPNERGHVALIDQLAKAMTAENILFERLDGAGIHRKYPQFNVKNKDIVGLYQKDSGFVNAGLANAVHTQLARKHGAEILENTKVTKVAKEGGHVRVSTNNGDYAAENLIIACGAWNNDILEHLGVKVSITVTQEQVSYFGTPNIREFLPDRFPVWICHGIHHDYHGTPINPGCSTGIKIGADASGSVCTADTRTFQVNPERLEAAENFLQEFIPGGYGPELYTKTCLYELTPDRHFILDSLACKGLPNVHVFMGCGHGYASLIGKIFAQLILLGSTEYPISDCFRIDRPALRMVDVKEIINLSGKKQQLPPVPGWRAIKNSI
ncbi:monomeric sarcosine oxidase-like isoform X2 [Paramacrobiotus metropolitanus]|uniref:monomeric sarcosine oxidase-like isoform X2 n=1 Tax=Paramacrobiotus metropolitanus TaxID=2943436 RepID=UPI002445C6AD|nr:monomeric sarcosine oxidase-like isoform X2 [Paramacrobiotus metropolitanus]